MTDSFRKPLDDWQERINNGDAIVTEVRTSQQNRALHKYFQMVADDMNDAGYDAQTVITLPIQLTGAIVKDQIFKAIMKGMNKDLESTTQLLKSGGDGEGVPIQDVMKNMQRALAEKFGITTPFPDRFGE